MLYPTGSSSSPSRWASHSGGGLGVRVRPNPNQPLPLILTPPPPQSLPNAWGYFSVRTPAEGRC